MSFDGYLKDHIDKCLKIDTGNSFEKLKIANFPAKNFKCALKSLRTKTLTLFTYCVKI